MARFKYVDQGLSAYINGLPDRADRIAEQTTIEWKAAAYNRAPVSSDPPPGHTHMRDQLEIENAGTGKRILHSPAPYSGYVEEGTRFMAAQPWFRPAMEDAIDLLPGIARKELQP
ncbi:MAG: hypothetical protein AB7R89_06195 [Dehalococcoidia bacterium]